MNHTAPLIVNSVTRRIEHSLARAHRDAEPCVIAGSSGVGKTVSVRAAAADLSDDVHYVGLKAGAARKEALVLLLRSLRESADLPSGEAYVLTAEIEERLAGRRAFVIVDEAHGLDRNGLENLAYLHSHADASWTLVLVGAPKLASAASSLEHIASRCSSTVTVDRLDRVDLLTTVRGLDPVFSSSDDTLLLTVDERHCHGNLRRWSRLARDAAEVRAHFGRPDWCFDGNLAALTIAHSEGQDVLR